MSLSEEFQDMNINPGMSLLSIDDPSDPEALPARKVPESKTRNEQACILVKAFKDFILPIMHSQGSGLGAANRKSNANDDTDGVCLGPVAQQLVDALENFFTLLVSAEVTRKDEAQSEEVSDMPKNTGLVPSGYTIGKTEARLLILSKAPERPRLLTLALDEARYQVFNKMPIRLLTFKSDGSGIKLLDRSDTWNYVSTMIEVGFNEDQLNQDIQRRNDLTHNPGAEKEAIKYYISSYMRYAILSHTWLHNKPGEVTYGDWNSGNIDKNSPGYQKFSAFCKVAAKDHGITLAWMDTVCINKESSSELDESIRSMFKWYCDASVCITYLAQITTLADMDKDAWFTRGWTLQELLAPRFIKFYNTDWEQLTSDKNDKENSRVQAKIWAATTITSRELLHPDMPYISRRMQWAANRQVTREEDTAYSLMGIFNVSFSIAYGEGAERAFFRLAQQILNLKGPIQDLINWGYGPDLTPNIDDTRISSLIPSGPQQYSWSTANVAWPFPSTPLNITHLGLHLSVLLMPAISVGDPTLRPFYPIGGYYGHVAFDGAVVGLANTQNTFPSFRRYNVLDKACQNPTNSTVTDQHQITLGVLNCTEADSYIFIPTVGGSRITCFAVALSCDKSIFPSIAIAAVNKQVEVLRSRTSITFDLLSYPLQGAPSGLIPKQDLAQHGMQLLDMYL